MARALVVLMRSSHALQAAPRHSLRMPGFPRSKNSRGAPERELVRRPDMLQSLVLESTLTCPACGAGTTELMPNNACIYDPAVRQELGVAANQRLEHP